MVYNNLSKAYSQVPNGTINAFITKNKEASMYLECGEKEKAAAICKSILSNPLLTRRDLKKDTEKLLEHINES